MNYNSLPKVPSIGSYNSSSQKSNSLQKNHIESSKMSTANTKKNSIIKTNSINNERKKRGLSDISSNSFNNKVRSSFTQARMSNVTSETNSKFKNINSYLNAVNHEIKNNHINNANNLNYIPNNINPNNNKVKSTNRDLVNRLKKKSTELKFSITSKNYYINIKNKNHNVNSFKLEEEPNNINIKKNNGNQDFTKGINILGKFDTYAYDIKFQSKDKNKFNKTAFNYYFDKSKNLKNTKSFDINFHKNDNKNKDKKKKLIETKKNKNQKDEIKIIRREKKNEEIICVDKNEKTDNEKINNENDKNKININNNKENIIEDNKIKHEKIYVNKNELNQKKDKDKDKDSHMDENKNNIISKKENEYEKDKNLNKNDDKEEKETIGNKSQNRKKSCEKQSDKKDKDKIDEKEENRQKGIKNEETREKEEKSKEKEIETKEVNNLNESKKEDEDKNKENKDQIQNEQKKGKEKEKEKEGTKYESPIKRNKSKKKKKYSKAQPSNIPIIIQFKPLSPKNNSPHKDPDDLLPTYFNTDSINNVQIPKDYLNVIYYNLLIEEKENRRFFKAEYNYMNNQKEINEQMRSILIDWIIDVHGKFGFCDETLYMTVLIIDRYSSIKKITRNEYQCLGITALMIACKHEEINVPKVEDFIYITDNAYKKDEVFNMEIDILDKLKYNLLYPSPIKFYEYLSLHFEFDKKKHFLGKYLMETFLLDLISIKFKPSVISCACIYIVMKFFKMKNYKESYLKKWYMIEGKEGYEVENGCGIKDCAQELCNFVDNINNTNYLSCQKKYSVDEYCNISKLIVNYPENNNNKNDKANEDKNIEK